MARLFTARTGPAVGAIVAAFFGAAWLVAWCLSFYGPAPGALLLIAGGTIVLVSLALRKLGKLGKLPSLPAAYAEQPARRNTSRSFAVVNAVQWVAIFAAAAALSGSGHPEWIGDAVILIVGLHFFPLATMFDYGLFYLTGAAMVVLALAYPWVSHAGPADPVGFLGAGLILWATSIGALIGGQVSNV